MNISFCGHREFTPDTEKEKYVIDTLVKFAEIEKEIICYTGGCGSFDWFAASCIQKAQSIVSNIRSCLIIPYIYASYLDRIKTLKEQFDEVIYPPLEAVPKKLAIIRRNEWMIDNSDLLIACVKYSWGGAAKTMEYARRKKLPIINISK